MHPEERVSEMPLLGDEESLGQERSTASQAVTFVEVSVDIHENKTSQTESYALQQQGQYYQSWPIDLTDKYEMVGGIPAFAWKPRQGSTANFRLYSLSSDGSRLAVVEFKVDIDIYDAADNFLLLARGKVGDQYVKNLAFVGNSQDKLVVCYDSKIALVSIVEDPTPTTEEAETEKKQIGRLEILKAHDVFPGTKNITKIGFVLRKYESGIWIYGWSWASENKGVFCFWTGEDKEGFHKVEIKRKSCLCPSVAYLSGTYRTVVLVYTYPNPARNYTRLWQKVDFEQQTTSAEPIEIFGRAFDWSPDGLLLPIWLSLEGGENRIDIYSGEDLAASNTGTLQPILTKSFSSEVILMRVQFLNQQTTASTVEGHTYTGNMGHIAIMSVSLKNIKAYFWDTFNDEITKEIDLQIPEMSYSHDPLIEFCVSPDVKWLVVGCWTDGTVGVFSLETDTMIWKTKLDLFVLRHPSLIALMFDPAGTRLMINANRTLFALAPACFASGIKIDYDICTYDLDLASETSFLNLSLKQQQLIPKNVLWTMLCLKTGPSESDENLGKLDIANSSTGPRIALLLTRKKNLVLLYGQLRSVFLYWYKMCALEEAEHYELPKDVKEIAIDETDLDFEHQQQSLSNYVFLYFDIVKNRELLVVFSLGENLTGVFIDPTDTRKQEKVHFSEKEWTSMKQSNDHAKVTLLRTKEVLVIDLNQRHVAEVQYSMDLKRWFEPRFNKREQRSIHISQDGKNILYGWDKKKNHKIVLSATSTDKDVQALQEQTETATTCAALTDDLEKLAFVDFDQSTKTVHRVGASDSKNGHIRQLGSEAWHAHTSRILDDLVLHSLLTLSLSLDETNGCLWIIALYKALNNTVRLSWLPFGPYSTEGCLPTLCMLDYPNRELGMDQLQKLFKRYGSSIFAMPFNGITNFLLAVNNKDGLLMTNFFDLAYKNGVPVEGIWNQCWRYQKPSDLLKICIEEKNRGVIEFFTNIIHKKLLPFETIADMMKDSFRNLWFDYRPLIESLLSNDALVWRICELNSPSVLFDSNEYLKLRIGTSSLVSDWRKSSNEGTTYAYWKSQHEENVNEIETKHGTTKTMATIKFFCIEDACRIGQKGILRFLLLQKAPSHIFKTTFVKWIITWKWENIWKKRFTDDVIRYVVFALIFTGYAIGIGYTTEDFHDTLWARLLFSSLLLVSMFLSLLMAQEEYTQLQHYSRDGRQLFAHDCFWGIKHYFSSGWNIVELTIYLLLLTAIPSFHAVHLFTDRTSPALLAIVSFELILIWIKFWYFAQAFENTGAQVLLIENVIRDCLYFLYLACIILIGFSLALFVLFQQHLADHDDGSEMDQNRQDIHDLIEDSFGSPIKAMLTMFYAMIGTFDPEVYLQCGKLAPLANIFLVAYLAIQLVVMLNMLIAIMGDTFDRVKHTEEEQFLMGRARFIDACEASLSNAQAKDLEKNTQKYLYAVFPVDDDRKTAGDSFWDGRVKVIERKVGRYIQDSQEAVISQIRLIDEELSSSLLNLRSELKTELSDIRKQIKEAQTATSKQS